ncbi:MAG: hypothetical protein COW00_10830 [Bdellovibrio sp. CG12_big_fil_rev_8_21_14_0_65_39_13]|nr:MAG: hypothetical protein COW00_10830 [Bdellovibrio sp. CG12_big_fil_rev_8_21_14_0_65_39_13]PJB54586.1 MAG: hypothetical protein CO099_00785 [Bdellovibrio sp. CG_4_9_14_3_um_filter_39_7]
MNSRQRDHIERDCSEVLKDLGKLDKLKNQKIFISGGSGFMGSWILEILNYLNTHHAFNTQVIVLSPHASQLREKKPHLFMKDWIKTQDEDVRNLVEISSEVEWVIHAAATPDNRVHSSDPLKVADVITNGTSRLMRSASMLPRVKNILNVSSGLIYGRLPLGTGPITESSFGGIDCSSVTSAYAESKRMGETLSSIYRSQFRMPLTTVRPFAFIGPYQLLDRPWAINNFIRDALKGDTIRILGHEGTIRSYMYPSDMAYWILRALVDGKDGMTLNLGSPEGYTLRNIAEEVARNFSTSISISASAPHKNMVATTFIPDVSKAKSSLGLEVSVNFQESIKRTLDWYKLELN